MKEAPDCDFALPLMANDVVAYQVEAGAAGRLRNGAHAFRAAIYSRMFRFL